MRILGAALFKLAAAWPQAQPPGEPPPTFRATVDVFQIRVQVRADKGQSLPALTNGDFKVQMGERAPGVLHSELAAPSDEERRRYKWPKDEPAAIYVLTVEARASDCKAVPKVTLVPKGLAVRGTSWTPSVSCMPPGYKVVRKP